MKLVITHLSGIKNHDAHMVHLMTQDCMSILQNKHPEINWNKFILWSDGCASQYKGNHSFYYLGKYSVYVERNYFASKHGKGPSDAETGLISMKLQSAIKSREAVLRDAKSMYEFLLKNHSDDTHLFKLVNVADLTPIMNEFKQVSVQTLSGQCTRSLHQIKRSTKKNYLLQRRFSCLCSLCGNDDYNNCLNKQYTGGDFTEHKLPIKYTSGNENEDDYYNDEEPDMVVNDLLNEDKEEVITVNKQNLQLNNLKEGDFAVVAIPVNVKNQENIYSHWVYKITRVIDEEEVFGLSYKPHTDTIHNRDVFYRTNEPEMDFDFKQIIMILPDPLETRSRYIFPGVINLKQKFKMIL